MGLKVGPEQRRQVRRDGHFADAGGRHRDVDVHLALHAHDTPVDMHRAHCQVQILPPQLRHLAEPEAAPGPNEHPCAVGRRDLLEYALQFRHARRSIALTRFAVPAFRTLQGFEGRISSATAVDRIDIRRL